MKPRVKSGLLRARSVWAGYDRESPVLRGLSLSLEEGRILALLGANGAGKSTLIRVLAGLMAPWRGEVTLRGRGLASMGRRSVAREVTLIPQGEAPVFAFSVEDMVRMGRYPHLSAWSSWTRTDSEAVARAMDLTDLGELGARPVDQLSGGERQRAALARGLAQGGRFLLLDEPTAHLDLHHCEDLVSLLLDLRREGHGILVATHDLAFARRVADQAVVLKRRGGSVALPKSGIRRRAVLEAAA